MLLETVSWLGVQKPDIVLKPRVYKVLLALGDQVASLRAELKDCQVMTSAFSVRRTRCVIPDQQVSVFVTTVRYILGVFIRTCIEIMESVLGVHTVLQGYFRSKTP